MKCEGFMLVVKDMETSKRFYQEVLKLSIWQDLEVYVVWEGFSLMSEAHWNGYQPRPGTKYRYENNVCQLYFEDEDIDAFMKHLEGFDLEIACPLTEYPWGQRSVRFYDPDRHLVEVGESMKMVIKRFLKSGLSVEETVEKSMFPPQFVLMCQKELEGN